MSREKHRRLGPRCKAKPSSAKIACYCEGREYRCVGCLEWKPFRLGGAPDPRCDDCAAKPIGARHLRAVLFAAAVGASP